VDVTLFEVLDQHLEEFSQRFEVLSQHTEVLSLYSEVLFQHFEVLFQLFEVLLQHFKYCPNILGTVPVLEVLSSISGAVPEIVVLSLHFLEELKKASKFSV